MADRPTIADLRAVTQPRAVTGRRNSEHWTADVYLRRFSPYLTRMLLPTRISPNGVTVIMILTGMLAGCALVIPGMAGAATAVLLGQLQMLWDCCDGELARWRQAFTPAGIFLDKIGHYSAESAIPLALGVRADGGFGSLGGWTTMGAVLALLVVYNKALNDLVHVSRAFAGLPRLEDRAGVGTSHRIALRRLRSYAGLLPVHRAWHSVEMTLLALGAALVDVAVGGLDGTRVLLALMVPAALATVLGHLAAILSSGRLR